MEGTTQETKKVENLYNFTADLGSGRVLQISGNLFAGDDVEVVNAAIDKVRFILDRQQAISAIPGAEEKVRQGKALLEALKKDKASADERFDGRKLSNKESAEKHNLEVSLRRLTEEVASHEEHLEKLRKEAE